MTIETSTPSKSAAPAQLPDFEAIKKKQHGTWASGDYAVIGTTLQIVGELLAESTDIRAGEHVLDVAAGNGNATLAAARRFASVTATDYVPALLDKSAARAKAEGLAVSYQVADAENLPFPGESFDVVLSTFGVMFTPQHTRSAGEMLRVVRPGGRIGLANWTPEGFIGQLFVTVAKHAPQANSGASPFAWGTEERLDELFGVYGTVMAVTRHVTLRARTPMDWVDGLRAGYAPVLKAFAGLDSARQKSLRGELLELVQRFDRAPDSTMLVDAEYLEVVVTRR